MPRVLLVDPEGALQGRLRDALEADGFSVEVVESAAECIRSVESARPAGIISRHELPDLDGVQLLRSLRVSNPTLPFLLAPKEGSESIAADAVAAAVSGYLPSDASVEVAVSRLRGRIDRTAEWAGLEGEHRYRHLLEISPAPINLFDASGVSIWGNDAVLDLLGLESRAGIVGRSIFDFIHPDDHERARAELAAVIEQKESVGPSDMRLRRPDGEVRHIQVSTAVGRFLGADIGQAVIVDVTALRSAQEALEAEQAFVDETLDTLQDIFYVIDLEGNLLQWNDTANAVGGYTDAELGSMTIDDFVPGDDVDRLETSIATILGTGSDSVELALRTKDGRSLPYEFRGRLLRADDGEPRIVGIGRDVSDRRERNRQLKALEQWLRHNIRNDINIVQGLASKVAETGTDDVRADAETILTYSSHLVEQADRERDIVDLITEPPERLAMPLGERLESIVPTFAERFPTADVALEEAVDVDVLAVPALVEAVEELVQNAVEHNDGPSPTVRLSLTERDPETAVLRIADDGPGLPWRETEILFEEREIDQLHHGTGMGLMYVYWVVRACEGDIEYEEADEGGSVITIVLETEPT